MTTNVLMELADRFKDVIDTNMMDGTARRTLHKLTDELRTAASEGGEAVGYHLVFKTGAGQDRFLWADDLRDPWYQQKVDEGIAELKPMTYTQPPEVARDAGRSTGTVADISDDALLCRVVRSIAKKRRRPVPAWDLIGNAFALGSTYSAQLCRRFGVDPDTGKPIPSEQPQAAISGAGRDGAVLLQALTDPENQPSQWGTIPLSMLPERMDDSRDPFPIGEPDYDDGYARGWNACLDRIDTAISGAAGVGNG